MKQQSEQIQIKQQNNQAQKILDMLNDIWNNLEEKPKLSDFDSLLKINKNFIEDIENKYSIFVDKNNNISISYILANIIEKFTGKLIFPKIENNIIIGWQIIDNNDNDEN